MSEGVPVHLMMGALTTLLLSAMLFRVRHPVFRGGLLGLAIMWVFLSTVFTGYGRLTLVALAMAGAAMATLLTRSKAVKAGVLLGVAPALVLLSRMREQFGMEAYGQKLSGIGSVVSPLQDFGLLASALSSGRVSYGHFDPFFASLVFWIPRSSWSDKPEGFGRTLTAILQPETLASGQSLAALNQGEFMYAFGWAGVVTCVVVTGLYVRGLDWALVGLARAGISSRRNMLLLFAVLIVIADLPNLMWGGTFGHLSRVVLRLVPLLLLLPFGSSRGSDRNQVVTPAKAGPDGLVTAGGHRSS